MKAQQDQLEQMLAELGWRIVSRSGGPEWWLDEVWALESSWSPVGARAFVSFLVDGMARAERKRGEGVWAVSIGKQVAPKWCVEGAIPLHPGWEGVHHHHCATQIAALRN